MYQVLRRVFMRLIFRKIDRAIKKGRREYVRRIGVVKKIRGKNQDSSFEVGLIGYE